MYARGELEPLVRAAMPREARRGAADKASFRRLQRAQSAELPDDPADRPVPVFDLLERIGRYGAALTVFVRRRHPRTR